MIRHMSMAALLVACVVTAACKEGDAGPAEPSPGVPSLHKAPVPGGSFTDLPPPEPPETGGQQPQPALAAPAG